MKLTILAKRRQEAHEQLLTGAAALAGALDLPLPELAPQERDPVVARLRRDEALGRFLADAAEAAAGAHTAVLDDPGALGLDAILAIPGLSKASAKAIEAHVAALTEETEDA